MNALTKTALAVALAAALGGAWWLGRSSAPAAPASGPASSAPAERQVLYYRNPMGLADTSPVPKKDSMGMDYLPVYGDDVPMEPGTVALSPERVQMLGVRTEAAVRAALGATVRASATVEVDETRQFVVAPRFEGWIETLYANQTGMAVKCGQPLATLYSPELVAALEEARIAETAAARLEPTDPASAATMRRLRDASQARLRNWQVSGARLDRQGGGRLVITAPADAVVIEKSVVQGDRFEPGQTILRLADLSQVWVVADVPGSQVAGLAIGDRATFETTSLPGRLFEGRIEFLQPVLDRASRTVGVRITLANEDGALRPGLYGDAVLTGAAGEPAVVIPRSAVIDSGTRQVVLVEVATGRFEPREVQLGQRDGDRVAVRAGLREGESVVTSGNFLLDAESNLGAAMQGMTPQATSPTDSGDATDHSAHAAAEAPGAGEATEPTKGSAESEPDPHAGHAEDH
ncbi:efflux RND transporter periplasmic adaptor subunit [Arenimonas alkanexedens]